VLQEGIYAFNRGGFHPGRDESEKVESVLTAERMPATRIAKLAGLTTPKAVLCLQALTRAGRVRYSVNPAKKTAYVYWKD